MLIYFQFELSTHNKKSWGKNHFECVGQDNP